MFMTETLHQIIDGEWVEIAAMAWAGYLNDGRGVVKIDAITAAREGSRGHIKMYVPMSAHLPSDEECLVCTYDPLREVVVCALDMEGRHSCRVAHDDLTPPAAFAKYRQN